MSANRDGFQLMEVAAAPLLMKRRGLKRKSETERGNGIDSTKKTNAVVGQLESVPEGSRDTLVRPSTLTLDPVTPLMDYRDSKPPALRNTREFL